MVGQLVDLFENYKADIESMPALIEQNKLRECQFILHKLKSAAGNLGAERLATQCSEFETKAHEFSKSDLMARFQHVIEEFSKASVELRHLLKKMQS